MSLGITLFASGERSGRRTKFFVTFVCLVYKTHLHLVLRKADDLSRPVIGAASEVYRLKGPGLIASIYVPGAKREGE